MQIIPLTSAPASSFDVQIDGVVYTITVRRNSRQGVWTASFYYVDGTPLVVGIPLVLGTSIIGHYALPFDHIYMYSTDYQVLADATEYDLGTRVVMLKLDDNNAKELEPPVNVTVEPPTKFLNGDGVQFLDLDYVEMLPDGQ